MKFVWVPSINRFRRTETEVKKEKLAYEVVEFETDKDSLIDRFNAYEERIEALQAQLSGGAQPAVEETPDLAPETAPKLVAPPPTPRTDEADMKRKLALSLRSMEREAIEDAILNSKGSTFGSYLSCAIGRLGELGRVGWSEFAAHRNFCRDADRDQSKEKFKYLPMYGERGLRLLALMQVKDLDNGEPLE